MSLIDDIKRDREAGSEDCTAEQIASPIQEYSWDMIDADIRRRGRRRILDMEAALLAAEELADAAHRTIHDDCDTSLVDALAAYRRATEGE